jgi:hypothetical protein
MIEDLKQKFESLGDEEKVEFMKELVTLLPTMDTLIDFHSAPPLGILRHYIMIK